MKTLLLLRHAKAGGGVPGGSDHERALTPRGQRAAELVALYLSQRPTPPSLALCSSARRTLETLEPLRQRLDLSVATLRDLYLADPDALLAQIAQVDDREASVIVIAHNPGLHELALLLAAGGDAASRARLREGFPTAALAVLELDIDTWDAIRPGCGRLAELHVPRDLV
jgi:phosphohistidine phosphatase